MEQEGKEEKGGEGGNHGADDEEEMNAARSIVSFSSKKETKEPWPPLFCIFRRWRWILIHISLYKQLNINMTIINSLLLFIRP